MHPTEALGRIDDVLEHRVRLAICVLLSRTSAVTFSRFKELLEQTDGNLGAQLRRLEDAGYIALKREFVERKPVTWYWLTARGREALRAHVRALESVLGLKETRP
jgi:DNA-binding PadR family transcriptional regulator